MLSDLVWVLIFLKNRIERGKLGERFLEFWGDFFEGVAEEIGGGCGKRAWRLGDDKRGCGKDFGLFAIKDIDGGPDSGSFFPRINLKFLNGGSDGIGAVGGAAFCFGNGNTAESFADGNCWMAGGEGKKGSGTGEGVKVPLFRIKSESGQNEFLPR